MKHLAFALPLALLLPACAPKPATSTTQSANISALASIPSEDLQSTLADLTRSHQQKIQLAFWVSTPLRSIDPPFKSYFETMGKRQNDLLTEIQTWAAAHHISLTYHYSDDLAGRAQKIMEDGQEKLVRNDDKVDFQRDILMQMYNDYEWQISEIQALLPAVKDPALKSYLQKSLKVQQDGSTDSQALLKHYQFNPTH